MSGNHFKRVSSVLSPNDMVRANALPLDAADVPDFIFDFYAQLKAQQATRGRNGIDIVSGFLCGGSLGDLILGETPKDYDLYLCSPDWVDRIKKYIKARADAYGQKEVRELSEDEEAWTIGAFCPITPDLPLVQVNTHDALGEYFEFTGRLYGVEGSPVMDIRVGTEPVAVEEYLSRFSAPIFASAVTIDDPINPVYIFHKDWPVHLISKLLVTELLDHPDLMEKAERKGWQIVRPSDLRPLHLGGHGHEDGLGVSAGLKAKLRPPVV